MLLDDHGFLMASNSSSSVSQEEFIRFHRIDRELFRILVLKLWRDPVEAMEIMALWLWLEGVGFHNIVKKMISLPHILMNELADEAVACLTFLIPDRSPSLSHHNSEGDNNIPLPITQILMEKEISLQFLIDNQVIAARGIARTLNNICARALKDIAEEAMEKKRPEDRTLFLTFSKGYPVAEREVKDFFGRTYGDCVESLCLQPVQSKQQSLFALMVFHTASTVEAILNGHMKVKFSINGKHVWARKFVPKRSRFFSEQ